MRLHTALLAALPLLFACRAAGDPQSSPAAEAGTFEVVQLQYASAPELADTLSTLVAAAAAPGKDVRIEILADRRTNSLLVMAPPDHMANIKALVARLDVEL